MKCPKCRTELKETDVVKYKDYGSKKIGTQKFCPNMKCDYEGKITK